ncbi:MAG: hypothetical protein PW845_29225 [Pseudomonas sp.]|nr:hypothetical protein [Pseudomonas sp.]
MSTSDLVSTVAITLIGATLLILLVQYLRLRELWTLALSCQKNARRARQQKKENRELRCALCAEKACIADLRQTLARLQDTQEDL